MAGTGGDKNSSTKFPAKICATLQTQRMLTKDKRKKDTDQRKQIKLDIPDTFLATDLANGAPSAPKPGGVVVNISKIDGLIIKRRTAGTGGRGAVHGDSC